MAAGHAPVEIELIPGFRDLPPAVEDGATFEENAVKKAMHYARHAPGCCSRTTPAWRSMRWAARPACIPRDSPARRPPTNRTTASCSRSCAASTNRTARFVCAIALVEAGHVRGIYRGAVEGRILDAPRGTGGFGYDPLFYYEPFGCTFGEATDEQKFSASHRGQALRAMLAAL